MVVGKFDVHPESRRATVRIMDHHAQLADFVDVLAVDFDIVDTTGRRLEENPNPKGNSAESWS